MALRRPRVVFACLGAAVAALAGLSLRFFSQGDPLSALTGGLGAGGVSRVGMEADDVQVVGHAGGRVRWHLAAGSVTLSRDRRTVTVTGIRRGLLYAASGRPAAAVTADGAVYQAALGAVGPAADGTLRVDGHVRAQVLTAAHPALRTQTLLWDASSNQLSAPGTVSATLPRLSVTAGNALYAAPPGAPTRGTMRLGGGVHALFRSPRGVAVFDCPGLLWDAGTRTARTLGPVTARIPGGLGTTSAVDLSADTRTGDLAGHGFRGTLRLPGGVQ